MHDAIVVGAGLNGLVAAGYLARAGRRVLVLEARDVVGGTAVTEEFAPGFRCETLQHDVGWLPADIVTELGLAGVEFFHPDPVVVTPVGGGRGGGRSLSLSADRARTAAAIRAFSPADAARWEEFHERMARLAGFLQALYLEPPPQPLRLGARDLVTLVGHGRRFRGLGKRGMVDLLRVLPMAVAELLDDWFETDALKGMLAAGAVTGLQHGPRAGGTAFGLVHHLVGLGGFRSRAVVRGGIGALAAALADVARRHGAEIRTGAKVRAVSVREGRAAGVMLAEGDELPATTVVSALDPRATLLGLVEPEALDPEIIHAVRCIKFRGAVAKVNLALAAAPRFSGVDAAPGTAISICPSLDYLERAYDHTKYGEMSSEPGLEVRLPTALDPGLAPAGKHVLSVLVQYAPYRLEGGWTPAQREALGDRVVATLAEHAPGIPASILHRQVLTPADIETRWGLTEGNLYHGEPSLDQILFMRPLPGWSRYRMPVDGLYLCSPGAHPGGGVTGVAGRNAARMVLSETGRS
jgi:phytoene dehydrogenase-like protein